jgi:hypothetical protein
MAVHVKAGVLKATKVTSKSFVGPLTGGLTGDVTGQFAAQTLSGAAAASKVVAPSRAIAVLTKSTAGVDYTLAAPGTANVGKVLEVLAGTAAAHVVTVTGLAGGTTMTFGGAIGDGFKLFATSASVWTILAKTNVTQS